MLNILRNPHKRRKRLKERKAKPENKSKMADLSHNIINITLNIKGLSTRIKRQSLANKI